MNKKIGIIGDFNNLETQVAIAQSIEHSNRKLGVNTLYQLIETTTLGNNNNSELLTDFDGIWSAS
jgi:hypothetical protein